MIIRVLINTPDGAASNVEKRFRKWIIGKVAKIKNDVWVNKENNQVMWEVEADVKTCLKINRNVLLYDRLICSVFENKASAKALKMMADSTEDFEKLKEMLKEHTSIEVIKEATAQEIVEQQTKKTWIQKIKDTFQRQPPDHQ